MFIPHLTHGETKNVVLIELVTYLIMPESVGAAQLFGRVEGGPGIKHGLKVF